MGSDRSVCSGGTNTFCTLLEGVLGRVYETSDSASLSIRQKGFFFHHRHHPDTHIEGKKKLLCFFAQAQPNPYSKSAP